MALSPTTGTPPAVTHEQIEAWTKLADDIAAAMTMGGQQGLDFLLGIMAEWSEAVDDVNAARQICVDLAERGLRHEAIHWHADGFFEIADRLDPDRPGWETWQQAFMEREVITPQIDPALKEMANRIFEELETRDLAALSLADHLAALRRNMLLRGPLGERLVILESIRGFDPSGSAWDEMLRPIRRQRADTIVDDVKAAAARRDFEALAALRAEVASQDWGEGLPASITGLLAAASHCESLGELRSRLSQAAAVLVSRVDACRRLPEGMVPAGAAAEAVAARKRYTELRVALTDAIQGASAMPETAAVVTESGVKESLRQLDVAVHEPCVWVAEQEQVARIRVQSGDIEASLLGVVEAAPAFTSNLDDFKARMAGWLKKADKAVDQARRAVARLPAGMPASTEAVFRKVQEKRQQLEAHVQSLERRDRKILVFFLAAFGGVLLLIVTGIIVATISK